MFCVIQEIQHKKADRYGAYKELQITSEYQYKEGTHKYGFKYSGGRFDRPIRTAYKVSIHRSQRVNGKVMKQQFVVGTYSYYDLLDYPCDWWLDDTIFRNIGSHLNVSEDDILDLVNAKLMPLVERIQREFEQTEEYKSHTYHVKIIQKYSTAKYNFTKQYGCVDDIYDYIFDVFGNIKNRALYDKITYKPPKLRK